MSRTADIVLAIKKVHQELFPHSPTEPEVSPEHVAVVEVNRREIVESEARLLNRIERAVRSNRYDQE